MARPDKVAVVDRVTEQFNEAAATLLTDYRGLTVEELAELRAKLREVDASYNVVKNTLTRIAAKNAGVDGLDDLLTGPTALVFCGEDPVGPAKALKAFGKDHEALVIKGGYLDGAVLDAEEALKLADLESREDLLAKLAGMMNNALAGFARLLNAGPSQLARLMGALEAEGGAEAKGFSPSAAVAPAAEAAASPESVDSGDSDSSESEDSPESADSPESVDSPASADSPDAPEAAADDAGDDDASLADKAADVAEDAVAAVADAAETVAEKVADVAEAAADAVAEAADGDETTDESDEDESDA